MPYKIEIKRGLCIGAGTCLSEAPGTFDLDDQDIAIVIDPRGDSDEAILCAAQGCPTDAIVLIAEPGTKKP
jgi:ferredoxin